MRPNGSVVIKSIRSPLFFKVQFNAHTRRIANKNLHLVSRRNFRQLIYNSMGFQTLDSLTQPLTSERNVINKRRCYFATGPDIPVLTNYQMNDRLISRVEPKTLSRKIRPISHA